MSEVSQRLTDPRHPSKETPNMFRRLIALVVALVAVSAMTVPVATATAASPWWQILDGSRPTNLWKPSPSRQEIVTQSGEVEGLHGVVQLIQMKGETVGCLGAGEAAYFCNFFEHGAPPIETASQLEALLKTAYGRNDVSVTGGPVGSAPLIVTVGGSVPTPEFLPIAGTATDKVLDPGGSGRLVVTLTNLGDAEVDGTADPVTIVDELPEGVVATGVEAFGGVSDKSGPVDCEVETQTKVVCSFENELPSYEAIEIEIPVDTVGESPAAGAPGKISVSGGNAPAKSSSQEINISPDAVPFGIERFSAIAEEEGGGEARRAGSHPFQLTTTLQFKAGRLIFGTSRGHSDVVQPAQPRNLRFTLPVGLVGNATVVPTCSVAEFYNIEELINQCPDQTTIGAASVTVIEKASVGFTRVAVPLFNLEPSVGEPAKFGFTVAGAPVVIDTEVDPDNRYRIAARISNASQLAEVLSSTVTIWGTPGDPLHDASRGWKCVYHYEDTLFPPGACESAVAPSVTPFLRMPVSCKALQETIGEIEPWNTTLGSSVAGAAVTSPAPEACNHVPFNPVISSAATSSKAGSASGLDFELKMPNDGLLAKDGIAEGQAKKVEVVLPEGVTVNPSQGEVLGACSPGQLAQETASSPPGAGCPDKSNIGSVEVETPLLAEKAHGSIYVAEPYDNPFGSLLALYIVARIPERGILIKQAGKVELNPATGQLVTTFDNLPQLPFSSIKLHFREGERAPLVTPPSCGPQQVVARFTPWPSTDPDNPAPGEIVTRTSTFNVERGVDGGACPSGAVPPFHPGLLAGTTNNAAGHYSPFTVRLTRNDGEQEFTNFSIKLPPGVIGKLAGIPFCPDAGIAAAKARTGPNGGQEELDNPSCPAASQVGRTLVGAGVGPALTYVPGKLYLAGPYHGSPLSIAAIVAAKVGPFDLGTVVIREALKINPDTAEVFVDPTGSDPIPHIIQGIPVHARDIRIYVDRQDFVLNPTSCERTSTASTVLGSGLDFSSTADDQPVTVTSPFQAADCAALGFKPKLSLRLRGGTHRGDTPALEAVVKARKGDANIGEAQVTLPHSEFLEQGNIGTICTRVQFAAGDVPGEKCPPRSIYGHARAITPLLDEPIEGPVYLRSSPRQLPDLVAALHSGKIDVNVTGYIDAAKGGRLRTTFATVPDAPVTKFVLKMQGGKKGLLVNSTNICKGKNRAIADFTGQNGKKDLFRPLVKGASCRNGGKKGKRSHRHHG